LCWNFLGNYIPKRHCVKCDQPGTLSGIDPKKATYCKPCFVIAVKHKFASTIGKRRLFKDGNRRETLIVYEGNPQSAFLLSSVFQGMKAEKNKRLILVPTVYHYKLLSSCASSSMRLELVSLVRDLLTVQVARCLGIDKVMMPDCAEDLAGRALSSLAFGRGSSSIACLTEVVDKRFKDTSIIRPLHDICLKEIALINRFDGCDEYVIHTSNSFPNPSMEKSVQSITVDFLGHQQAEGFKGVINTILSTSAKLQFPSSKSTICSLCCSSFLCDSKERFVCYKFDFLASFGF
uniref:Cytoplasmic tRNA 2-thiolation protein 2 n=1 Tax=Enterobius vermicularis TaxID=51028 RepID=A0A0N4UW23_ENTVE